MQRSIRLFEQKANKSQQKRRKDKAMKTNETFMPLDLQMFAEGESATTETESTTTVTETPKAEPKVEKTEKTTPKDEPKSEKSLEDQLQELRVMNAKLKKAQEKASSEAADFKRQLRARQTEDEIALQEKAEKEAEKDELIKKLTRENTINQLTKNFLALNYNSEEATEAAIAQYDGETEELFAIQSKVQERLLTEQKNQWLASRPDLNVGVGEEKPTMTLEQFKTATMPQIVEFKKEFPETYKKYINS